MSLTVISRVGTSGERRREHAMSGAIAIARLQCTACSRTRLRLTVTFDPGTYPLM